MTMSQPPRTRQSPITRQPTITIASLQVGRVRSEGDPNDRDLLRRAWTTGFSKEPVVGPVTVTRLGLVGDSVADTRNHGGPDKAILCYAVDHYQSWRAEYPELEMAPGGLGENLTLAGGDESTVCIGDRYRVGDCEFEVSQPRQPCWKIARRWGVKTLTKAVAQTGRTGWYLRVLSEGTIAAGEPFERTVRPHPAWPVSRANDVLFGREVDRVAVIELMGLPELARSWKDSIA